MGVIFLILYFEKQKKDNLNPSITTFPWKTFPTCIKPVQSPCFMGFPWFLLQLKHILV